MKRLGPLIAIEVFVWLVLMLSAFFISRVAFSINMGSATALERVATQVARNSLAGLTIIFWLLVWKKVTDLYLRRTLSRRAVTA